MLVEEDASNIGKGQKHRKKGGREKAKGRNKQSATKD